MVVQYIDRYNYKTSKKKENNNNFKKSRHDLQHFSSILDFFVVNMERIISIYLSLNPTRSGPTYSETSYSNTFHSIPTNACGR